MRNSTSTNLLLFDEVFDASLDASGCDELIKILNNISGSAKTNIFVISHKTDILLDKFEDVIRFSKKNNFSRMEKV
jgi:energy-coupling factor transporter ATP-binding protein EcfA2